MHFHSRKYIWNCCLKLAAIFSRPQCVNRPFASLNIEVTISMGDLLVCYISKGYIPETSSHYSQTQLCRRYWSTPPSILGENCTITLYSNANIDITKQHEVWEVDYFSFHKTAATTIPGCPKNISKLFVATSQNSFELHVSM